MDRALAINHLAFALGEQDRPLLPTPAELQAALAEAEIALFTQQPEVSAALLTAGWYLHGVASADSAADLYSYDRQRQAFQVSAHIFDLGLDDTDQGSIDRLRLGFAAQIGYRRGELDPNAVSVYRRLRSEIATAPVDSDSLDVLALRAAVLLLGFDPPQVRPWLSGAAALLVRLRRRLGIADLNETPFGAAAEVIWGSRRLVQFLTTGGQAVLKAAEDHFAAGAANPNDGVSIDVRWAAIHLRRLCTDLGSGSVWTALPPEIPPSARQALTLSVPPVLTLWPPQRELVTRDPSPLSSDVKRLVLSLPTSAGKTLMAQLLVVSHLSTQNSSVCYVAPMRSLGRELRKALASRLRHLDRQIAPDLPDFLVDFGILGDIGQAESDVDVVTPERLFNMLRHEPQAVLNRYGLFVFDEAQLLGEPGRGFVLEQVMSYLQWKTRHTDHRIVLLSAALGNRGQLVQWLGGDGASAELFESQWRGPRRLHALYGTRPDWDHPIRTESVASSRQPWRVTYPLIGSIRIRPVTGTTQRLRLHETVGEIALRRDDPDELGGSKEAGRSTPFRFTVAKLASVVAQAGPALVVTSTRDGAKRMAEDLASLRPDQSGTRRLRELVVGVLGVEHPLAGVVGKGVAFHHAGLPREILDALEEAFREGLLGLLTCTTTLTEGVNLPARTVVIAETPSGPDAAPTLSGARLVNAIGRAGRAGKESEGWIVLALSTREGQNDFDQLTPSDDDLVVESRLSDPDILASLASYEEALREGEDAIFSEAAIRIGDFLSFVWFLLASEEAGGLPPLQVPLEDALGATLAATQLDETSTERWLAAAEYVRTKYVATPSDARARYSRRGTLISTAAELDRIVTDAWPDVVEESSRDQAVNALGLLRKTNVISQLLELPESAPWQFKETRTGPIKPVNVDPDDLLQAWIDGDSPSLLSEKFLSDISRRDWASEQIVDALSTHFESYISWMLGSVIESLNDRLAEANLEPPVCPGLPAYARYGVRSIVAVTLLTSGIRSRRLANAVANDFGNESADVEVIRDWLGAMSIPEWRERFRATPGELLDLIDYARKPGRQPLVELLEQGETALDAVGTIDLPGTFEVFVQPVPEDVAPPRLGVFAHRNEDLLTTVSTSMHSDVAAILDTALVDRIDLEDGQTLKFRLAAE